MIVKFFQHDIRQGLVKYIGRYILAVLIGAIALWYGRSGRRVLLAVVWTEPVNMGIWVESISGTKPFFVYRR